MENKMKEVSLEKITINIGTGEPGDRLERAKRLLATFTKNKVATTASRKRSTFGVPKGRPIGCMVTLRGQEAEKFLKMALDAKDFKIKESSIDKSGNVSFGIHEHIEMPGVKYDPSIGIFGMDVCVTLTKPGYRVKKRKLATKVGKNHMITREECAAFLKKQGVEII